MMRLSRYIGQVTAYVAFAALIGYFAGAPAYTHFPPDQAMVKLSFSHGGQRKGECRQLTPEEIARLPPNMRRPVECPRERVPLLVELEVDGRVIYRDALPPTGLARDGPSHAYRSFAVAPGSHRIVVRLRDSPRSEGFDRVGVGDVELRAQQSLAIDFRSDSGFLFR
jgi:hypothetical protein